MKPLQPSFAGLAPAACALAVSLAAPAFSQSLLVDFGPASGVNGSATANPDANSHYWNNYTGSSLTGLLTTTNGSTGIGLSYATGGAVNTSAFAVTPTSSLGDLNIATAANDAAFTTSASPGDTFNLTGLNPLETYDLILYGARDSTITRVTTYTVTGTNSGSGTLTTSGTNLGGTGINYNNNNTLTLAGITANASNAIAVNYKATTGGFGYLNAMQVTGYVLYDGGTRTVGAQTYLGDTRIQGGAAVNTTAANALNSAGALTINTGGGTLTLSNADQTVAALGGSGNLALSTGAYALILNSAGTTTYSGNLSGGGALVKTGGGTQILAGSNSYSGGTTIQNGVLQLIGGNDRLAAGGVVTLGGAATSGKLVLGSSAASVNQTLAGLLKTGNGGSVVGGHSAVATLTLSIATGTDAFGGMLGGAGTNENNLALLKTGAGVLTLASGNTFSGGVTLSGGTLGIFEGNSLGATAPVTTFAANSTLQFEQSPAGNVSNLRQFAINSGVTATFDTQGFNAIIDSAISGSGGSLAKTGGGKLTLTGSNTYSGGLTLSAGILNYGNVNALGSGSLALANGATLQAGVTGSLTNALALAAGSATIDTSSNTVTLAGVISGSGGLVKSGSGTLILGYNSLPDVFTGGVTLTSGTLGIYQGNGLGALPASPTTQLTFAGTSTLQFQVAAPTALNANRLFSINSGVTATIDTQAFNVTLGGAISGTGGGLAKAGSGTLTLNGANTYGGGTALSGGTLVLGNASALGAAGTSLTVAGATLNLNGNSVTVSNLTSQSGAFTGFNLGGGANTLAAASATTSGTNSIGINGATIGVTGTYNLITASGGGLGGTFQFAGAQDLTVPVSSLIAKSGGSFYRVELSNTGTAEQVVVSNNVPGHVMTLMPLGASITAGYSAQANYNGGGYRTQLYQNLVNDGRFTPDFVGSSTAYANTLLTTAGQTHDEGHFGYTTNHILDNLNGNDGATGNNGGYWLAPDNGVNPNYVPLNVGGNDGSGATPGQAVNRLDAIVSKLNELRPGVDTIVSNLPYRTDVGAFVTGTFNPNVQATVYNHVLAGQNVQFLDLYTLITPGNSLANISSDGIHPTQAGYNLIANAWYHSLAYGSAYWTGTQDGTWGTVTGGNATNWAMDAARTTDRGLALDAPTDVYFNHAPTAVAVSLTQDNSIRSLNFTAGATAAVTITGNHTLTLGSGGITVQQGTGAHSVAANISLAADQTWGNVSANPLTLGGVVSGSNHLTISGAYTLYTGTSTSLAAQTVTGTGAITLTGNNTYSGGTTIASGTLLVNNTSGSGTGSGTVEVAAGGKLGGSGRIAGAVNISTGGLLAPGNSPGNLTLDSGLTIAGGATYLWELAALSTANPGTTFDTLTLTAGDATISGAILQLNLGAYAPGNLPFWQTNQTWSGILNNTGTGALTGSFAAIDNSPWSALGAFTTSNVGNDVNLVWTTAIPEPTVTLLAGGMCLLALRRRRFCGRADRLDPPILR